MDVRLFSFRCHRELEVSFQPGRHFLCGVNGRGKTSVLEAVHLLSRLRSFRTRHVRELATWGESSFRAQAAHPDTTFQFTWKDGQRQLSLNGQPASASDFWGRLSTVFMSGDDRELVSGPAGGRRAWVDALLAQTEPDYLSLAQRYQRTLKQRNAWLRSFPRPSGVGQALTSQLTELGLEITRRRAALSFVLEPAVLSFLAPLAAGDAITRLAYEPSFSEEKGPDWNSVSTAEERLGVTLLGPHRDDWRLLHYDRLLGKYGSEGQQRSAALAMRLAEAQRVASNRSSQPVFLIDDVTGPLDLGRQAALAELLPASALVLVASPQPPPGWAARPGDTHWQIEPSKAMLLSS